MEQISYKVKTISMMVRKTIENSSVFSNNKELTGFQSWIIGYIYKTKDKKIYQKDIENIFMVRRSSATEVLQNMEKNGYLIRTASKEDARLKEIHITEKAEKIQMEVIKLFSEIEIKIKRGFSEEEFKNLNSYLDKIEKNLE